eukprot:jgi/Mesvir1/8181/Mv24074-RA.1
MAPKLKIFVLYCLIFIWQVPDSLSKSRSVCKTSFVNSSALRAYGANSSCQRVNTAIGRVHYPHRAIFLGTVKFAAAVDESQLSSGAPGYMSKVRALQNALIAKFGSGVFEFDAQSTPGVSGFFEVDAILPDGSRVQLHSKKNGGGHVDSSNINFIFEKLQEILKSLP